MLKLYAATCKACDLFAPWWGASQILYKVGTSLATCLQEKKNSQQKLECALRGAGRAKLPARAASQGSNDKSDQQQSAQDFALCRVARYVEELDLVDGLEMRVIGEFPNHFLGARDLEEMRLFAEMAVTKIIAENRVAVRQALHAGHQAQRIAGDFIFAQFPHDF